MFRLAKVGLAIVIAISVAGILTTPDLSDDVDGAIQRPQPVRTRPGSVSTSQLHALRHPSHPLGPVASRHSALFRPLDLMCVMLC